MTENSIHWVRVFVSSASDQKSGSNTVYNFPVVLSADSTTDSLVILNWTPTFYVSSQFNSYQLFRSTIPNVENKGNPINKDGSNDIGLTSFEDSTAIDTLYYKLYHKGLDNSGKLEIRGSNEIKVTH